MNKIDADLFQGRGYIALAIVAVAMFSAGFFSGRFSGNNGPRTAAKRPDLTQMRLGGYKFINPLLECDVAKNAISDQELYSFEHLIERSVDESKKRKWASSISVYFREMNNGIWFDVNGKEKFAPASLVKVPLLMAYFKAAESDPALLAKKFTFSNMPDLNSGQNIPPAFSIERGKPYSVHDLLFRTIVYSDNNAYFLLHSKLSAAKRYKVYSDLGLAIPNIRGPEDHMSVIEYASFFRILFNASYLNREMSEKALGYMSEVDFKQGLVAGVPGAVAVAHKFGEKTVGASGEIKQLHDCGIVYYPNNPYLLCVMSRGDSFEYLDDTIREISHIVYEEVDRQHRTH